MPLLKYLADTNVISDFLAGDAIVKAWIGNHADEIALSTLTLAELRRGIELRAGTKAGRELERKYKFVLEDYAGAIFVFDEACATEWGRLMAEAHTLNHPLPYEDSLIGAVARSLGIKVLTKNKKHFPGCDLVDPSTGLDHSAWQALS